MKCVTTQKTIRQNAGFTLVEMIGVLAVIAVLAALLILRVFSAINDARLNSAVTSYNTIKSAAMTHFGKYGRFGGPTGTAIAAGSLPYANWDSLVLLAQGLIEKPFEVKVGSGHNVRVAAATGTVSASNADYNLDGDAGGLAETASATVVSEVVITGVSPQDAKELNDRIDGTNLGSSATTWDDDGDAGTPDVPGTQDIRGRVKYGPQTPTDVHIYIGHN
jgi:prepilin-type N-terminal cleavage/methylation domain-containing protein